MVKNIKFFKTHAAEINEYWGDKMPLMCAEEAGELIQAISKVERNEFDAEAEESLKKEIRDMYIVLEILMYRYGIGRKEMEDLIKEKLEKKY